MFVCFQRMSNLGIIDAFSSKNTPVRVLCICLLLQSIFYKKKKKIHPKKIKAKYVFNEEGEKKEFALGNRALVFWQGKKAKQVVLFISDVEICGTYLSLTLGTAKLKLETCR